jgi:NAD(P)-dependent dehydrogenase (short-subunit alcohol dehydrogenase family)/acyl dehydratase
MLRTFSTDDQLSFARLSGDFNPMHVDPVAARRLMFGRPVVHGIHALLWALDTLLAQREKAGDIIAGRSVSIVSLQSNFRAPIIVGDAVELSVAPINGGRWKLEVSKDRTKLATTVFAFDQRMPAETAAAISPQLPEIEKCRERAASELTSAAGQLPLTLQLEVASKLFPIATRLMVTHQLATLLATTRLVGMELPGLHSLFTGLELFRNEQAAPAGLLYAAEEYDPRFSMLKIAVTAPGLAGKISAALRPAPTAQAGMDVIHRLVKTGEFAGQRALVIGGSRGLGEVVAKELAAGGAEVRLTYFKGSADAQRIVAELKESIRPVQFFAYDVTADAGRLHALLAGWSPTALYYFATPFIFSAVAGRFSAELFRSFCACYVENFLAAFMAITNISADLVGVFYPSSSALDEPPANMVEYSSAKAAAEMLCRSLQKSYPAVHFSVPRLARLATDQTASLLPVENADPAAYMLELLRRMNAGMMAMRSGGPDRL